MSEQTRRTNEEIEKLKASWLADPVWDIEKTDGFEAHYEELLSFRMRQETEWAAEQAEREEERHQLVREQTGVDDFDITSALYTFNEIERDVERQNQDGENSIHPETAMVNIAQAQVRATLLLAAQMKRVADELKESRLHGLVVSQA